MKSENQAFETRLSVQQVAGVINDAFRSMKASVNRIQASDNPLDAFTEDEAAIAVVGARQGLMNQWAVQAYIYELDDRRGVEFVALGDGGFGRAMNGTRNTASLSKSTQQMQLLVAALKTADPQARAINA